MASMEGVGESMKKWLLLGSFGRRSGFGAISRLESIGSDDSEGSGLGEVMRRSVNRGEKREARDGTLGGRLALGWTSSPWATAHPTRS